jgi:uncharacterized protein (TIGR02118 family)
MALAAFHEHWRTRHAELVVRLPGIRGYLQNFPIDPNASHDAIAESSFDDTAAMKALARTPEYATVLSDEPNFIDPGSMGSIITEEHVIRNGPAAGVKTMRFVTRNDDMPLDAFFGSFLEAGRLAAQAPGVLRHAQYHTRRSVYESGRTPAYDCAESIWSENGTALPALPGFIDALRSCSLVVVERVVSGQETEKNVVCP